VFFFAQIAGANLTSAETGESMNVSELAVCRKDYGRNIAIALIGRVLSESPDFVNRKSKYVGGEA
jgi:hypothetical protein